MSSIKIQEAPQTPSYAADPIQVPANIASPQSTMDNVKAGQEQLNSVNTLSGGRHRGTKHQRRRWHKSFIRTYKGRRYTASKQQTGGSTAAANGGQIPVPQVGALCSSGPQCSAVQNANLTALGNQATSSGLNDSYATGGGGSRRAHRHRKSAHNDHHHHHHRQRHSGASHRKTKEYSLQSTIAYNMNKLLRKIFT
jgi:hypothetical protein